MAAHKLLIGQCLRSWLDTVGKLVPQRLGLLEQVLVFRLQVLQQLG